MEETDRVSSLNIASQLRERILDGRLAPGERIRQEQVAEDFGASRLPVRDALRRLEADGLVTIVANTGAWVSKLTESECADAYQIRERLEPLLLKQGMLRLEEDEIQELEQLAKAMENAEDVESFLRLDREFHLLTYSEAPAGMVRDLVERLWNTTQHYRRAFAQVNGIDKASITHMEHSLIIDSIKRQDVEEAQRVLAGHIRRTRVSLIDHPELFS